MFKKIILFIFFIVFIVFPLSSTHFSFAQVWDSCPFGLTDDPYPGECGRYIDTNQDGICDLSQSKPDDSITATGKNTIIINNEQNDNTTNVSVLPEEEEYSVEISGSRLRNMTITEIAQLWGIDEHQLLLKLKENFLLETDYTVDNTINDLRTEMRFSPSLVKMVAEELKKQNHSQTEDPGLDQANTNESIINQDSPKEYVTQQIIFPDYNLMEIGLITLLFYLGGKWLADRLKISTAKERKFWNVFLLISFIGSAGTGFILILIRDFDWFRSVNFNFLFWHVEFSIAMGLIGIFHALWHVKYYWKIFHK